MAVSTMEYPGSGRDTMTPRRGARTYALLWSIQCLAVLHMAVVTLALAIAVRAYSSFETGSVLLLAIAFSLTFIPFSAASPLGGLLADRWGPKKTLLASNTGCLVLMAMSSASLAAGLLPEWLVWVAIVGSAACKSVQLTALESSVPILLPKRHISRANGPRMFLTTPTAALAFPIAAALLPVIGLQAIILITCIVLIAAIACVARAEIPPARLPETAVTGSLTIRRGTKPLWAYIRSRRGLVALFGFFAVFNFVVGFAEVADREVSRGFGSPATLTTVLVAGSISMLATTAAITIWGTPRRPVRWLLIYSLVFAAALVIGASRPNLLVVSAAAVLFLGSAPFIMAIIGTLLHTKTEPGLMGRMMGLKTLVVGLTYGAGNVVGALCGAFPKPLIGGNHLSTGFLTILVGTGQANGRGYAVMTMMVGVLTIVAVLLASRHRSLRYLDTNLPDVTSEDLLRRHASIEPRPSGTEQWQAAHRPTTAAQRSAAGKP